MRALSLVLVLLVAIPLSTVQAGGQNACEAIPHTFTIGAIGQCSVSFTSGPGVMSIGIESVVGNTGLVTIDAVGPAGSRIVVECPMFGSGATCVRALTLAAPGAWTVTAHAQAANPQSFDSWTRLVVVYP